AMVDHMEGITVEANRPEEGQKGLGFGHRRGGTGRASYRRPPEGSHLRNFPEGKRGASATSKAPGAKRKVESMRDKGAKRAASGKLHIDDGCMGGGGEIIHYDSETDDNPNQPYDQLESYKIYMDYFIHGDDRLKGDRYHLFHYCAIVNSFWSGYRGWAGSDDFYIAYSEHDGQNEIASTFMHELGHNLNLNPNIFDGVDSKKYSLDDYDSVMNYNAPEVYYKYSSGGKFNDWENLDLKYFNT
ncbi:MAG: hypothetical protein R6V01_05440, partial [Thermoplasmatota archaeon]